MSGGSIDYELTGMAGHTMEIGRFHGGYCCLSLRRAACGTYVYAMQPQSEDEEAELPTHLTRIVNVDKVNLRQLVQLWAEFQFSVLAWVKEQRGAS